MQQINWNYWQFLEEKNKKHTWSVDDIVHLKAPHYSLLYEIIKIIEEVVDLGCLLCENISTFSRLNP